MPFHRTKSGGCRTNAPAAAGDERDPADRVIFRDGGHGQAVDVIAARREQPRDLGEDARFVVDHDCEDVAFVTLGMVLGRIAHAAVPSQTGSNMRPSPS